MNKNEVISHIVADTKMTRGDAERALDSVLSTILKALQEGEDVRFIGFGTFSVVERKATEGRDPRTKQPISIPASKSPKFKAGKLLKDAVNK